MKKLLAGIALFLWSALVTAGSINPPPAVYGPPPTNLDSTTVNGLLISNGPNPVTVTGSNTSNTIRFLTQTGDGVNANVPSWQPFPALGSLSYYFQNTASDIATYLQQISSPYSPKTTLTTASVTDGQVLYNFATNAGFPGITFIPAGGYEFHIHTLQSSGTKTTQIYAEFWEVSNVGVDIALIGTTEMSSALTGSELEFPLFFANGNTYSFASTSSRIVTRIKVHVTGGGSAPTVQIFVGGTADSHISLPSNTVDATNFVPYTGATQNLAMGAHSVSMAGTSSGVVTVGVAPAAGTWALTLPTGTGSSGQVLQTDGTGVSSWVNQTSVSGFVPYTGATATLDMGSHDVAVADTFKYRFGGAAGTSYITGQTASTASIAMAIANTNVLAVTAGNVAVTGGANVNLAANQNVTVDGSTNPRTITEGVIRVNGTAAVAGTRSFYANVNGAGFGDTHGLVIDILTGAIGPAVTDEAILVQLDGTGSTGGSADALHVSLSAAGGLTSVDAVHVDPGVNPLNQLTGAYVNSDKSWWFNANNSSYTDVTTGTTQIFSHNSDILYIGKTSGVFNSAQVTLSIGANTSILPTFQYWNGSAWTAFTPSDGTNGMQQTGTVSFTGSALTGWVSTSVNGTAAYYIRITRTKGSVPTPPTESSIQLNAGGNFYWNKTGDIVVNTVNGNTITGSGTLNLASGSTLATSGANSVTLTSTGTTSVTLPTSGTLATTSQIPNASWVIKTTTYTAAAGDNIMADTNGGAFTITLPNGVANSTIHIADYRGTFATNNLTIGPATGENINGQTANTTLTVSGNWTALTLVYIDSTVGWRAF